jgi:hypothetical protein
MSASSSRAAQTLALSAAGPIARFMRAGVRVSRIAGPTSLAAPPPGLGTDVAKPRCSTCGSANTSSIL